MKSILIVGNAAENSFVEDISHHLNQNVDSSDIISMKDFLNSEFCPRFIVGDYVKGKVGDSLAGMKVLIVSTSGKEYSRNELAMRTFLIARAAKDNGAEKVILLEPDLYYSAQDRGPRKEHGVTRKERSEEDYWKFDGQPFSARLYADLLKESGVDEILTVHNHSYSVENIFMDRFSGAFTNLQPQGLYGEYIRNSDIVSQNNLVVCAPDAGAFEFSKGVAEAVGIGHSIILMCKKRTGERSVEIAVDPESELRLEDIRGKDVLVVDDMVRTGRTITECCKVLKTAQPRRVVFLVTHFNSSREGRFNMDDPSIDEIVTTSTIPDILNRDIQGRLRKKLVVLKLERWIADYIFRNYSSEGRALPEPHYREDMSSKNPRWKGSLGPLFVQKN
ncbi:MAG: ribose-phosphate pyrophosphokinase [Spirochaetales bacterium]|nr:ribose-phosphate pyrophosphokinase [Spirochaetales bacterium]